MKGEDVMMSDVDSGSFISDESSFYGGDEMKAQYEDQSSIYDPSSYWSSEHFSLASLAAANIAAAAVVAAKNGSSKSPAEDLYNPHEGLKYARQLSESVDDFIARLPPSTTTLYDMGPWIWIANPHSKHRPTSEDVAGLKTNGEELLLDYAGKRAAVEEEFKGRAKQTITKKMTAARMQLEKDILAAAKEKGITCGKWMLFPYPENVNNVWRTVATATAAGDLGIAAKVATNEKSQDDDRKPRLICVYNEDFANTKDVKRVLKKLKELNLVGKDRPIYYKCDAYTYLDITSKNEYGLKASMYDSKSVLEEKE